MKKQTKMTAAQLEIHRAVEAIMRVNPGGPAFFDALDEYIRTCATRAVFDELLVPHSGKLLVMSGKFGRDLADRIDRGEHDFEYILFNGGIRSGAEPVIARSTHADRTDAVFVDDTIYGGRTYFAIKDHLAASGVQVNSVRVVYDGSPASRDFIESVFRFYDHYDVTPTFAAETFKTGTNEKVVQ